MCTTINQNNNQTILAIAYYNKENILTEDFIHLLHSLKLEFNIQVVHIGNVKNIDKVPQEIKFIKYGNIGYDGNCYKEGLKQLIEKHNKSKIIFLNNSVTITSIDKFKELIIEMNNKLNNLFFLGYSMSQEIKNHYQSFLFGINLNKANKKTFRYLNKLLKKNTPLSRTEVIKDFEIRTIDVLDRLNTKHNYFHKLNHAEKFIAYINFIMQFGFLNTPIGLLNLNKINFTLYNKKISERYGFRKIKNGRGSFPWGKLISKIWSK